jgi:UDPglucose 6-dehydrogenase
MGVKLCVVGAGHVGLVTGACFADIGHRVICVDSDKEKIEQLTKGIVPIYEPGLRELVEKGRSNGRLVFDSNLDSAVRESDVIFVAVGTPARHDGRADLSFVESVARQIARSMDGYKVIVEKSTVPVKTGQWVKRTMELNNINSVEFDVVSNPEFLREGSAVKDFMEPDRIVIGVENEKSEKIIREIYAPLNARIVVTDINSAEIIKHASNSFLALKISYINAIATICEIAGADVEKVSAGMGLDERIGSSFLSAGAGYGGSCFPKDVSAFIDIAAELGYDFDLLKVVERINRDQRERVVKKLRDVLWILNNKTIGVLGLSFKPDTDDIREAPSIYIIKELQKEGVKIRACDPTAVENARRVLKDVTYCKDAYEAADGSDALMILTEWEEFRELDLSEIKKRMNSPVIVDGRNVYDPVKLKELGFTYVSVGRKDNS